MPCEEEQENKKQRRINKRCCIQTLVPWSFFVASLEGGGERAGVCAAVSVDVLLRPLIKNNKTVAEGEEDGLVAFAVGIRSQTSFVCVSPSAFFFQPASGRRPQRRYATETQDYEQVKGRQQQEKDKQLLLLRNKIGEGSEARDNSEGEREGRSERETRRRELKTEYYTDTDKARAAATIPFPCTALNR